MGGMREFTDGDGDGTGRQRTRPRHRQRRGLRRIVGKTGSASRKPVKGEAARPRLPLPPAPVRPGDGANARTIVGWPHLMVNGGDGEFRRMLRGLAALVRRMDEAYELAGRTVGLTGGLLEFLFAIAECEACENRGGGIDWGGRDYRNGGGAGVALTALTRHLDMSPYLASGISGRLARAGMIDKRPDPASPARRVLALTAAGRDAVEAAWPLIAGAHNIAFAPVKTRDFGHLRRIAGRLDDASASAVDILARHAGENTSQTQHELRRAMRRLGGK